MIVPPRCGWTVLWSVLLGSAFLPQPGRADEPPGHEPLHERIDRLVEALPGPVAPIADDEEFFRRASLDLTGLPPAPDELRAFVGDPAPEKRSRAVDQMMSRPSHARHLAGVLDVMLMERRANTLISEDDWRGFLLTSIRQNKPFNLLARELLSADGTDPATRPAARFFLDRAVGTTPADRALEPNLLTRDIGRILFGRDMQCAQCHDHPLIDDYKQADYQGLLAFVQGAILFTAPAPDGKVYLAEKTGAEVAFESVFVKGERHTTGPRIPGGPEIAEPSFHPGDEYLTAPAEGVRPVPKFSRRAAFAEAVTSGANRWFNENIANRLWAMMMGRGLVHPPDLHHPANPASHPELLQLLGEEFARSGFNMRGFLRELALTRTYQRSIDFSLELSPGENAAAREQLAARRAELETTAKTASAAHDASVDAWKSAKQAAAPLSAEVNTAVIAAGEALKARDAATAALAQSKAELATKQDAGAAVSEAAAKAQAAAAKLPQDAEIAAAAQKFAERTASLTAEAAALAKAAEEKQAAAAAAETLLVNSRQALDAARAKLAPLTDAVRASDIAMAAARLKMSDDATMLASVEQRIASAARVTELLALRDTASAASGAVTVADQQLAAAREAARQQAVVAAETAATLQTSQQMLAEANQQRAVIEEDAATRQAVADSLGIAVAQATSASGQLPPDAALTEAVTTLQQKAQEAAAAAAAMSPSLAAARSREQQLVAATSEADASHKAAIDQQTARQQAASQAELAVGAARSVADGAQAAIRAAETTAIQDRVTSFAAAALKPLSPEQLCFSMLRVTGHYEITWKAEEAALSQAAPLPADATPEQIAARQAEIEQKVFDKLKANMPTFVTFYAPAAGQPQGDFFATVDQALFTANAGAVLGWTGAGGGNLTERMINQPDPALLAEDLYVTILSRRPTDAETAEVAAYLAARPAEKPACIQELIWALLTSSEFRFNH